MYIYIYTVSNLNTCYKEGSEEGIRRVVKEWSGGGNEGVKEWTHSITTT